MCRYRHRHCWPWEGATVGWCRCCGRFFVTRRGEVERRQVEQKVEPGFGFAEVGRPVQARMLCPGGGGDGTAIGAVSLSSSRHGCQLLDFLRAAKPLPGNGAAHVLLSLLNHNQPPSWSFKPSSPSSLLCLSVSGVSWMYVGDSRAMLFSVVNMAPSMLLQQRRLRVSPKLRSVCLRVAVAAFWTSNVASAHRLRVLTVTVESELALECSVWIPRWRRGWCWCSLVLCGREIPSVAGMKM